MKIAAVVFRFWGIYLLCLAAFCFLIGEFWALHWAGVSFWLPAPAALAGSLVARRTVKRPRLKSLMLASLMSLMLAILGWVVGSPLIALAEQIAIPHDYSSLLAFVYFAGLIVIVPANWVGTKTELLILTLLQRVRPNRD